MAEKQEEKIENQPIKVNYIPRDPKDPYDPKRFMEDYEAFQTVKKGDKKGILQLMYGKDAGIVYSTESAPQTDEIVSKFSDFCNETSFESGRNHKGTLIDIIKEEYLFPLCLSPTVFGEGEEKYNDITKKIGEDLTRIRRIQGKDESLISELIKGYSPRELQNYISTLSKETIMKGAEIRAQENIIPKIKSYGGMKKFATDILNNLESCYKKKEEEVEEKKEELGKVMEDREKEINEFMGKYKGQDIKDSQVKEAFNKGLKEIEEKYKEPLKHYTDLQEIKESYQNTIYTMQTLVYHQLKAEEEKKANEEAKEKEEKKLSQKKKT